MKEPIVATVGVGCIIAAAYLAAGIPLALVALGSALIAVAAFFDL